MFFYAILFLFICRSYYQQGVLFLVVLKLGMLSKVSISSLLYISPNLNGIVHIIEFQGTVNPTFGLRVNI